MIGHDRAHLLARFLLLLLRQEPEIALDHGRLGHDVVLAGRGTALLGVVVGELGAAQYDPGVEGEAPRAPHVFVESIEAPRRLVDPSRSLRLAEDPRRMAFATRGAQGPVARAAAGGLRLVGA